ncbi:hypothetical protein LZ554_004777 [Drepanopeziza brunnea f. sp. 'monogermtubi']|nr:hypothetical protein LZ554_004777 [Drepanopeziza brunnea f. sp. 'monogermtubi']
MPSILDIGLGKVGDNSHPIHPATVHLPIAFLLVGSGLDMLAYISMCSPLAVDALSSVFGVFFDAATPAAIIYHLSLFGYVSTFAGAVTAVPALTTGLVEGYAMVSAKGLDLSDPVVKTTVIHAGLNDVAVLGAVYNLVSKWGHAAFAPRGGNVVVSGLILGGVAYAAFLGGGLVYTHGVGVQRMGKGKVEKEQGEAAEKRKERKEL